MDPHGNQPVVEAGASLGTARAAVIMAHGRNASPANILDLVPRLERPALAYLAPAAAGRTWYPHSFLAPIEENEPWLTSALSALHAVVVRAESAGVPRSRIIMLGFSQGACLAAEFTLRHASRFGGLIAFSGGLIGPPGTTWTTTGRFEGTPVFLGCSDRDAHVPAWRVDESARMFTSLGADVTMRLYPGMGHLVNDDELDQARRILDAASA